MVWTWLIPAALLAVGPEPAPGAVKAPARVRERDRMPAPTPPLGPPIDAEQWRYPGMDRIIGGRSRGKTILESLETTYWAARTEDNYDRVLAYYRELSGTDGVPAGSGGTAHTLFVNDSQARPVKMTMIGRWFQGGSITITISRAENEKWTHIDLVYRCERKAH